MRVLILSCNTGEGHNSCAHAIADAFCECGDTCDIRDALWFISPYFSKFVSDAHTAVYRFSPYFFRALYAYSKKNAKLFTETSLPYRLLSEGKAALYDFITLGEYEAVICVHVFAGLLLTSVLRTYGTDIKTGFVATDYTCSPGVTSTELNICFIPHLSLKDEFEFPKGSKTQIISSGIPVRKGFESQKEKTSAKAKFGIPLHKLHLLIMCGSMGCGPVTGLMRKLVRQDMSGVEITVVCGRNASLFRRLKSACGNMPQIHIRSYESDISGLLDSADILVSKPGGLCVTEAAVKGVPMISMDTVGAYETCNSRFFASAGGAIECKSAHDAAKICEQLSKDANMRTHMRKMLLNTKTDNSANIICDAMKNLL